MGKFTRSITFKSVIGQNVRILVSFWVVEDEILPGVAGLLGSNTSGEMGAVINMGKRTILLKGLEIKTEDAPGETRESATLLFLVSVIENDVNISSSQSKATEIRKEENKLW